MELWRHWTTTFHIFHFTTNHIPTSLHPLMRSASASQGFVNQTTVMNTLKLKAKSLKAIAYKIKSGKEYQYNVGDVLRVATEKYATVAAFEQRVLDLFLKKKKRDDNRLAKQHRLDQVTAMFREIGTTKNIGYFLRSYRTVRSYVHKNRGTLDMVRTVAVQHIEMCVRQHAVNERQSQYQQWVLGMNLDRFLYLSNPVVDRFIYDGIGTKDDVIQEVLRVRQKQVRRDDLDAEMTSRGIQLRFDSRICNEYIRGETDASLPEVVATMKLSSFLENRGYYSLSRWQVILENEMKNHVRSGATACWYEACDYVIAANETNIYDDRDYEEEPWHSPFTNSTA
jgi:hypothetical protein